MDGFGGNLKDFWRLDALPPINRLSWWWWWVLGWWVVGGGGRW